jgi:alpha-ribazole phosphatase/probable phosphoglycerate mutase
MIVWFESHATSLDNEIGVASGHFDVELSDSGREQAREMAVRHSGRALSAIYTSDLKRAAETAAIAFTKPTVQDARLRECDYGSWTRCRIEQLDAFRAQFVDRPFPGGESYRDVVLRVKRFLDDLPRDSREILIIGHRATWYSLEHLLLGRDLTELISSPWRWRPGWQYRISLPTPT